MSSSDFHLTAEEIRQRGERRRRLILIAIGALTLLAAVVILARPASHAIKRWQARRHARLALGLVAAEKWNEAQKEATAAYQLAPNEPEATRAVARFLSRVRQPQALEFWDRLATQQPLNRDDLRAEAAVALALGEADRAATALKLLLDHDGRDALPGDWLLQAQLDVQRGAPNEASAALRRVTNHAAADPRERLQAAVLALRLAAGASPPDEQAQAEAWQQIGTVARAKDAAALDALALLAQKEVAARKKEISAGETTAAPSPAVPPITNNQQPITAAALAAALDSHPLAKVPQHLLATDLRMAVAPNEKPALLEAAIQRWRESDNAEVVALATWLNSQGAFQWEIETIPAARAVQDKDLFLQRLDALGGLGRWEEIRQALNGESFPLDPMIAHMYLARCSVQLGEETAAKNNWQRALEDSGGDTAKLVALAGYAEKNGATEISGTAYDTAVAGAPRLRPAWQGKLRLAQAARETPAIHDVLAAMLKIWPHDRAIQNDEAYVRLLITSARDEGGSRKAEDSELPALEKLAQDLVRQERASLPHRTLLALVYLRENRPATALGVYENLNVPPEALSPSALAVHAAVLQANGQAEAAAREAAQVPRTALLPEEAALISNW